MWSALDLLKAAISVCILCANTLRYLFVAREFDHAEIISNNSSCKHVSIVLIWQEYFYFYKKTAPSLQVGLKQKGYYVFWSRYEFLYWYVVLNLVVFHFYFIRINLEIFLVFICMKKSLKGTKTIFQLKLFFCWKCWKPQANHNSWWVMKLVWS